MVTPHTLNLRRLIKIKMGTWGTGIKDNDTSYDVYTDYISLIGTLSVDAAMERMLGFYKAKLNFHEEVHNFWFALALAQVDTSTLQLAVIEKVKEIIESGADLALWKELKASDADVKARKEVLNNFLDMLTQSQMNGLTPEN